MVFDKVEEVFIKSDSGRLVEKLQFYEPSTSFGSG